MGFLSNIFKKKEPVASLTDFSSVGVDFHSHLIPGIDDGAQTLEQSLHLIKGLHDLGYRKIITSPHIMTDGYPNKPDNILAGRDKVRQALKENGIAVEFDAWAEYYLDETIKKKIDERSLLTMAGNYVLVELSYLMKSFSATSYFYDLRAAGYNVVLAHPERYPYYHEESLEQYREIKDQGIFFQMNMASLTGVYGKSAKVISEKLIDAEMIDFISTDLHNERHLGYIRDCLKLPYIEKIVKSETLKNSIFL